MHRYSSIYNHSHPQSFPVCLIAKQPPPPLYPKVMKLYFAPSPGVGRLEKGRHHSAELTSINWEFDGFNCSLYIYLSPAGHHYRID
ncbi:hypothetical protein M413DRAFT_157162 [Hebeloma cylindrosporum]|uniref:Uncharacterized protein n=1 Tax=Hebeloma cylindrosporum TaxID=76867 RepID=A0A0C3BWH7_HEBCY|nr:hypothetical protein M413DRAFT_157162 [Hebeloma cylindrosporum h7]